MTALATVFWALWFVFMAAMAWFMVCNTVTYRERMAILNARRDSRTIDDAFWHGLNTVTYNQHMKARFLLQDPWRLYPESVLRVVRGRPA